MVEERQKATLLVEMVKTQLERTRGDDDGGEGSESDFRFDLEMDNLLGQDLGSDNDEAAGGGVVSLRR